MININANLFVERAFSSFKNEGDKVEVGNFTLVKSTERKRSTSNVQPMQKKVEKEKDFEKGDLIHVFGYFKKSEKEGKSYKKFVVMSYNKIEKKSRKLGGISYGIYYTGSKCIKNLGYGRRILCKYSRIE